jgi:hypothetical protein
MAWTRVNRTLVHQRHEAGKEGLPASTPALGIARARANTYERHKHSNRDNHGRTKEGPMSRRPELNGRTFVRTVRRYDRSAGQAQAGAQVAVKCKIVVLLSHYSRKYTHTHTHTHSGQCRRDCEGTSAACSSKVPGFKSLHGDVADHRLMWYRHSRLVRVQSHFSKAACAIFL